MIDSLQRRTFREGWLPTGASSDATLGLQTYMDGVIINPDVLYYFKPIATFDVPGLTETAKFEDIDSYISEEFRCDFDDIHTMATRKFGSVIVMPAPALRRAGVSLPRWPNRTAHLSRPRASSPMRLVPA
jgi:hypothetical protein